MCEQDKGDGCKILEVQEYVKDIFIIGEEMEVMVVMEEYKYLIQLDNRLETLLLSTRKDRAEFASSGRLGLSVFSARC